MIRQRYIFRNLRFNKSLDSLGLLTLSISAVQEALPDIRVLCKNGAKDATVLEPVGCHGETLATCKCSSNLAENILCWSATVRQVLIQITKISRQELSLRDSVEKKKYP